MKNTYDNLKNVYSEIWEIIKYLNYKTVIKIPSDILKTIRENKNENWNFKYNPKKSIEDQKIMEETKDYLSILFYKYCCNQNEKKDVFKHWVNNKK